MKFQHEFGQHREPSCKTNTQAVHTHSKSCNMSAAPREQATTVVGTSTCSEHWDCLSPIQKSGYSLYLTLITTAGSRTCRLACSTGRVTRSVFYKKTKKRVREKAPFIKFIKRLHVSRQHVFIPPTAGGRAREFSG